MGKLSVKPVTPLYLKNSMPDASSEIRLDMGRRKIRTEKSCRHCSPEKQMLGPFSLSSNAAEPQWGTAASTFV